MFWLVGVNREDGKSFSGTKMTEHVYVFKTQRIVTAEAVPFPRECSSDDHIGRWDTTFIDAMDAVKKWDTPNKGSYHGIKRIATIPDIARLRITDLKGFKRNLSTLTAQYNSSNGLIIYHGPDQPLADSEVIMNGIILNKHETLIPPYDEFKIDPKKVKELRNRCVSFEELIRNGNPKEMSWGVVLHGREKSICKCDYPNEKESKISSLKKSPRIISMVGPENVEEYLETSRRFYNCDNLGDIEDLTRDMPKNRGSLLRIGRSAFQLFYRNCTEDYLYGLKVCFVGINERGQYGRSSVIRSIPEDIEFKKPTLEDLMGAISDLIAPKIKERVRKRLDRALSKNRVGEY